jgi:DNA-directed RNA polymerase I, II, and III subunit RPABC1
MDTTLEARQHIVQLHQSGQLTYTQIAQTFHVSKSTVGNIVNQFKKTGNVINKRKGRRPTNRSLSERTARLVVRQSVMNPAATARQIRDIVSGEAAQTSVRTIQRYLRKGGRIAFRPTAAPALSLKQKQTRIVWARNHQIWTSQEWSKVSFTVPLILYIVIIFTPPHCHSVSGNIF